jgi:hypothetical protein
LLRTLEKSKIVAKEIIGRTGYLTLKAGKYLLIRDLKRLFLYDRAEVLKCLRQTSELKWFYELDVAALNKQ